MAYHMRRQVRDAFKTRLTGLVTTGARVYVNNVDPFAAHELPALSIRNGSDLVERVAVGSPNTLTRRTQTIVVTVSVKATATPWDTMDESIKEVEQAMLGDVSDLTLDGLVNDVMLVGIDDPRISGEADRLVAAADMQFQVLLHAREGIPDAAL